jgi:hypothetical protein
MNIADKLIIILSILVCIISAIFSIVTIIRTRNKYYHDYLNRKREELNIKINIKEDIINNDR